MLRCAPTTVPDATSSTGCGARIWTAKWHSEQTSRLDTYGVELTGGYAAAEGFLRRATLSYGYITTDRNTEVVARSAMDFMKHKAALAVEVRFLRRCRWR